MNKQKPDQSHPHGQPSFRSIGRDYHAPEALRHFVSETVIQGSLMCAVVLPLAHAAGAVCKLLGSGLVS